MELLVVFLALSLVFLLCYVCKLKSKDIELVDKEVELQKTKNEKIAEFFLRGHVILGLREYKNYTDVLEGKFLQDRNALYADFLEECKQYSEEDRKEIEEFYAKDYAETSDTKLALYRRSTLVW
ncbi:hypothetical protein SAMN02745127_02222 [Oceanospirillum multiglobuliferum]|uniref:Uncharacterized protein n=1 Tax=Oceanospirillum multiglobuliferum TaxID=64969 RepID=A0A1T4R7B3_9GAMM|nr:hypothetical protein [Oceanospirillum multiglobuliferum]OPX55199.1 hypothetical protein BTE48_09625 [Oceanospirillum multiglobuliferum]SKA11777.1 hypothetical protein SAMN02745127_02222 [Oceanospirillum multiglobuliferum]